MLITELKRVLQKTNYEVCKDKKRPKKELLSRAACRLPNSTNIKNASRDNVITHHLHVKTEQVGVKMGEVMQLKAGPGRVCVYLHNLITPVKREEECVSCPQTHLKPVEHDGDVLADGDSVVHGVGVELLGQRHPVDDNHVGFGFALHNRGDQLLHPALKNPTHL